MRAPNWESRSFEVHIRSTPIRKVVRALKTIRTALTALALLALLAGPALCQEIWQEQRITDDHTWFTGATLLWEDKIYWTDRRNGYGEIYTWDQTGGERRLIGGDGISRGSAAIWGDQMVVSRYVSGQRHLYLWDPVNGERAITPTPTNQLNPAISNGVVAWEDYRSGIPQIYVWDAVNGERRVSPTNSDQTNPRVSENGTVVWEDRRNGRSDVYMWNLADGEKRLSTYISDMSAPAIYQDRVTMWLIGGSFPEDRGLWEWTSDHGLRQLGQISYTDPYSIMYARMWGDLVVWQSGNGPSGVMAWDPMHGFIRVNQTAFGYARSPSVFENKVAWVGNYDIYLSTLVPEPSGLAALSLSACLLWPIMRRRTRH